MCSVLTDVEKARIKAEKMDVLKDRAFIKAIAKRTGVYIDAEVRGHEGLSRTAAGPKLPGYALLPVVQGVRGYGRGRQGCTR